MLNRFLNVFSLFIHIYMHSFSNCKSALFHFRVCFLSAHVDNLRRHVRAGAPRKRCLPTDIHTNMTSMGIIQMFLLNQVQKTAILFMYLSSPGHNCLQLQREGQRRRGGKVTNWREGDGGMWACSLSGWLSVQRFLVQSAAGLWSREEAASWDH